MIGADAMADVFISYSKPHTQLTRDLASDLEAKGLTVWWDTDLLAGESFRQRIIQELHDCRAAIVVWTPQSVRSDYVISEAERARKMGKLIQVRTKEVDPDELPPPFDTGHVSLIDDRKAIYGALARLGVLKVESAGASGPLPLFQPDKRRPLANISTRGAVFAGLASIVALGALASMIRFYEPREPTTIVPPTPEPIENRASEISSQFVDVLNARFGDSSLFDGVVRLGLRGNLTRVDAVNELRRSLAKYSKISCRKDGNTQTIGKAPEGRSGLRIKVDLVCDFADQAGNMMTENFPIEIEAVPDPSNAKAVLITGLWHSDRMVLWQPRARD
jgi:hypothetical protein